MLKASECLGIVHIPKCGGSALRSALHRVPGSYTGPLYFDDTLFGSSNWIDRLPESKRSEIAKQPDVATVTSEHRLVIGHYATQTFLDAGCTTIAIQVREPRCRILSLYRFWQAQPESEIASWGPWGTRVVARAGRPIRDFLRFPEVWPAVDNAMVRQALSYGPTGRSHLARRTKVARRCADLMAKSPILEWSTHSDVFLQRICESVGASTSTPLRRENVGEVVGDEQRIDKATQRLIVRLTQDDRQFLDHLSATGALRVRSPKELDGEFEATAAALGFHLD